MLTIITLVIALVTFSIFTHLMEAFIESITGDKRHWFSFWLQIAIHTGLALWGGLAWYAGTFVVGAGRAFFDWMYNHFKGKPRHYYGKYADSDKGIKKLLAKGLNPHWITVGRIVMFIASVALLILL